MKRPVKDNQTYTRFQTSIHSSDQGHEEDITIRKNPIWKRINIINLILATVGKKMEAEKQVRNLWSNLWPITVVLAGILIALIVFFLLVDRKTPEIILAILLIIGLMSLIITLSYTTAIFKSLELSDPKSSLGLPEGSMQAVIALSLLLIFIICSVLLYSQVAEPYTIKNSKVTQEKLDTFPNDTIVSIERDGQTVNNETLFKVSQKVEKTKASEDIAKQLITTVSTLVVAVAGFYFGSKAVTVAKGAVEATSDPVIRSIDITKNEGKRDEEIPFVILGKNFESPEVKLVHPASDSIDGKDITSSSTKIKGTFTIPKDTEKIKYPIGKWTVVVINSDKREDRLESGFIIS